MAIVNPLQQSGGVYQQITEALERLLPEFPEFSPFGDQPKALQEEQEGLLPTESPPIAMSNLEAARQALINQSNIRTGQTETKYA